MTEKFYCWLAWHLPRKLVMWCAIRVMSHATTTTFSHVTPYEVNVIDAISAWEK